MKADFWHERWQAGQIGFHQHRINEYLIRYWPEVRAVAGSRVFVPLCGKSLDMLWLRDQGHRVTGVELSPIAVEAFFIENALPARRDLYRSFQRSQDSGIELLCGDFFDVAPGDIADVSAVYDRASLIALPPDMRGRYAQHLTALLKPGTRVLLVTMEYPQEQMQGPPFAVAQGEVEGLYGQDFTLRLLEETDTLAANPRFKERGLTRLVEKIYLMERRER